MKLEILLYGLLALVPRPDTKQIDVIFMDTEGKKSSDSCEIHRHAPFFAFSPAEGECGAACPEATLTKLFRGREAGVDKLCVCDLEAGLLTFTGLVPPAQAFSVPSRPATVTKANQAHAGWILRISDAVAQASLADPSKLDKEAARVTLPLGGLSTCMLANFDTVNGIETYKVQLRDLHGGPAVGSIRPVAEVIKVSTDREAKVHVRLGGADGGLLCNARGCGGGISCERVAAF